MARLLLVAAIGWAAACATSAGPSATIPNHGHVDATSAVLAMLPPSLGVDPVATRVLWRQGIFQDVDLNGDGAPERIACPDFYVNRSGRQISLRGATGNGSAWVLAEREGRWFEVGDVSGKDLRILETRTHGWLDLWSCTDGGDRNSTWTHRFKGGRYVRTDETASPGVAP